MVLMLCVMMQSVLLIPHHHHDGTTAVCLDYTHLYASRNCEEACTDRKDANDGSDACATDRFVISSPVAREHVSEAVWHEHDGGCSCPLCSPDLLVGFTERIAAVALDDNDTRLAGHTPYLREYFTDALPSRAPACAAHC